MNLKENFLTFLKEETTKACEGKGNPELSAHLLKFQEKLSRILLENGLETKKGDRRKEFTSFWNLVEKTIEADDIPQEVVEIINMSKQNIEEQFKPYKYEDGGKEEIESYALDEITPELTRKFIEIALADRYQQFLGVITEAKEKKTLIPYEKIMVKVLIK